MPAHGLPNTTEPVDLTSTVPPGALPPEEAAKYIGRPGALKTLTNYRSMGKGPKAISVLGKPVYRIEDLDAYLAAGGDAA
ncbi:hypothetical protein M3D71_010095 [Micrococcus luteus]|uniref:hypothetical protein n=1 Tax=Micrococcus TaxID=1269 RepID=UPI00098FEE81|nr:MULTISPECIES: hypothetical protein [Micrococcus]MCV7456626.1 hypothetical protein [Micrococcus luteus]MCV7512476.1 hypothetical protein [Micrococcus luteus]MCV7521174.1 hypothetical protein [Micrococcus luteus]MCV7556759.1 hypothetical protein [Micrococcus luteus]QAV29304.1 hypothetical protein MT1254_08280 [Micrococcus luteus]